VLSKYGWNFGERLATNQEPSSRCVESRNFTPF
jgi:hypothetical protein